MSANDDDKKLNWMYKGPTSMVDREEYLLGRSVDKSLEQLNAEENKKVQALPPPKNHVEHECIPPSIRDFNKIVQAEQVDISAKLQEDPLVAIKKREEEARRQFLQNPVQLKKLQKALEMQAQKKKKQKRKSKHSDSDSDSDLDSNIVKKLALLKGSNIPLESLSKGKKKPVDNILDTILMHKFNQLKDKLSDQDLKDIMEGNDSDSEDEKKPDKKKKKKKKKHKKRRDSSSSSSSSDSSDDEKTKKKKKQKHKDSDSDTDDDKYRNKYKSRKRNDSNSHHKKSKTTSRSRKNEPDSDDERSGRRNKKESKIYIKPQYDSDGDEIPHQNQAWGLVKSDGTKIDVNISKSKKSVEKTYKKEPVKESKAYQKGKSKKLSEEEKEKLRREMMRNAKVRDKEREENLKKYRENDRKEEESHRSKYRDDFVHNQLLKSANTSSVEGRIKSNLNNIQRSSKHMDTHFSRR